MRFQLPQFIQTEVKLIGPFTLKQFMWVAAGGAILLILFIFTKGSIWFFVFGLPVILVTVAFAFVKLDGVPLINLFSYMLSYALNPKKYTYQKEEEANYTTPK